ncbi:thioredoxin domain-containing protein [Paludisphaera mucosa]|uniref:Thioredoxin domain-containing protein n=1 Tax=Paludisphaera mucosa TaxID=3030827 RepID=A0ABT6FC66_9BACT|nr:thioredoxin domain-containing protein [Paludisphaera mucosa]MDG3005176.1 thioredoxin domain-containing protein [Paludisphaera mucosa]
MKLAPALLLLVSVAQAAAGESQPVLLDFHADWCGPCRQMRPAVQALADKGYPVKSIDIDKSPKLAAKYEVEAVPTFIVVDAEGRELDRSSGAQPAAQLAKLYLDARTKAAAQAPDQDEPAERDDGAAQAADDPPADAADAESLTEEEIARRARPKAVNPKPWETVVRIKVYNGGSIGFGSGTIISSTPEESIILTCAHIFKLDGRKQATPDKFPNKIAIDLFDGRLKGQQQLTCVEEGIPGKAVDYDFGTDVGLIRIRPGRRLPFARVVPAHWQPQERMHMYTVGCSEGHDATAWSTLITKAPTRMLRGNDQHLAIECTHAPKQGRSGGGLYTDNGYVAGVCNFAEPQGDRGLYAAPESIYKLLDRNKLAALYAPASLAGPDTLLADRGGASRSVRGQSPDREERPRSARPGDVTLPEPEIVGIEPISPTDRRSAQVQPASNKTGDRRVAWSPTPSPKRVSRPTDEETESTDLDLDAHVDNSHFPPPAFVEDEQDEEERRINGEDVDVAPRNESRKPAAPAPAGTSSGWRPVKTSAVGR